MSQAKLANRMNSKSCFNKHDPNIRRNKRRFPSVVMSNEVSCIVFQNEENGRLPGGPGRCDCKEKYHEKKFKERRAQRKVNHRKLISC